MEEVRKEAEAHQMGGDREARPCAQVERESARASPAGYLRLAETCAAAEAVAVAVGQIR